MNHTHSHESPSREAPPEPRRSWIGGVLRLLFDSARLLILSALFFVLMVAASYWLVGWYIRGHELLTPKLTGMPLAEAMQTLSEPPLDDDRLSVILDDRAPSEEHPAGQVIRQSPAPGTRIKAGTPIRVVVSSGPAMVEVPELRGQTWIAARTILRNAGLELGRQARIPVTDMDPGLVLASDPPPGSGVAQRRQVNLLISQGRLPDARPMPDLIGLTVDAARRRLADTGMLLSDVQEATAADVTPGRIHRQFPASGEPVEPSTPVTVIVAPERPETGPAAPGLPAVELPLDLDLSEPEDDTTTPPAATAGEFEPALPQSSSTSPTAPAAED